LWLRRALLFVRSARVRSHPFFQSHAVRADHIGLNVSCGDDVGGFGDGGFVFRVPAFNSFEQ